MASWLRNRSFRRIRILLLGTCLVITAIWAASTLARRRARLEWSRPIDVQVVLVTGDDQVDLRQWTRGLASLEARLDADMRRWRGPGAAPFRISLAAPVRWSGSFPRPPPSEALADRIWNAMDVLGTAMSIDRARGESAPDVSIYVFPGATSPVDSSFAEGMGALNGDVAFVRASVRGDLFLPLQAIGHELLHTVGATDKYDDDGHAHVPHGLADPGRTPCFPQVQADWMAVELALAPGAGRLPRDLEEVTVGPVTAREIGWAAPSGGPTGSPLAVGVLSGAKR